MINIAGMKEGTVTGLPTYPTVEFAPPLITGEYVCH